jgi:lysophospholipase-3
MGAGTSQAVTSPAKTPIVLFPAFHFTKTRVTVPENHPADTVNCPTGGGTFDDYYGNPQLPDTTAFNQICRDHLLTLKYDSSSNVAMEGRFSRQTGVAVSIPDYGNTSSAPYYERLYQGLESHGWTRNQNIKVAGYQADLTPDLTNAIDAGENFVDRTKRLIEETYETNGNTPVQLVGHSNGPLYTYYFLNRMTDAWKAKYVHGFTALAGNWPGQGLLYPAMFTGINVSDLAFPATKQNAQSSTLMHLASPATYMSAADPAVFGASEDVLVDNGTGKHYTPADWKTLFKDAGMSASATEIADHYIGLLKYDTAHLPNVDVYAESVTGVESVVGMTLPTLTVGQVEPGTANWITALGDGNQEDTTNRAVKNVWPAQAQTPNCHRFEFRETTSNSNGGDINHFTLPFDRSVIDRMVADAQRGHLICS